MYNEEYVDVLDHSLVVQQKQDYLHSFASARCRYDLLKKHGFFPVLLFQTYEDLVTLTKDTAFAFLSYYVFPCVAVA